MRRKGRNPANYSVLMNFVRQDVVATSQGCLLEKTEEEYLEKRATQIAKHVLTYRHELLYKISFHIGNISV